MTRSIPLPRVVSPLQHTDGGGQRGILRNNSNNNRSNNRSNNSSYVARVQQRITSYEQSAEAARRPGQATLPWSSRLCGDSEAASLRRAASSPCLFVKQSSVRIQTKTGKPPIKLFGTVTSVGSLIEGTLSNVLGKDANHCETDASDTRASMPGREVRGFSLQRSVAASPPRTPCSPHSAPEKCEDNNINTSSGVPLLGHHSLNNNHDTYSYGEHGETPRSVTTSPPVSAARLPPAPAPGLRATRSASRPREQLQPLAHTASVCTDSPWSCLETEPAPAPAPPPVTVGHISYSQGEGRVPQEVSVTQRSCNNPEHFNSSEDEEIQKELSSILTNGQLESETHSVARPRFPTNRLRLAPVPSSHGSQAAFPNYAKSEFSLAADPRSGPGEEKEAATDQTSALKDCSSPAAAQETAGGKVATSAICGQEAAPSRPRQGGE